MLHKYIYDIHRILQDITRVLLHILYVVIYEYKKDTSRSVTEFSDR